MPVFGQLQRGRARESAEIPAVTNDAENAGRGLQRGRARESAEMNVFALSPGSSNPLQRGRARESAEMFEFNQLPDQRMPLQRGRARESAEISSLSRPCRKSNRASTGPRS